MRGDDHAIAGHGAVLATCEALAAMTSLGPYRLDLRAFFLPDRVLSRDELMRLAPPPDDDSADRSIDHRVTRLRRKLEADPEHPQLIKTVRGMGVCARAGEPKGRPHAFQSTSPVL